MRLRSADRRLLALWVTGFVLAFFFLGWVIRAESERELRRSAQQAGERWAQLATHAVPDLARALSGDGITPAARQQLLRLGSGSGVFRFKLFDAAGHRVLLSDDLAQPGALPPPSESDGIGHAVQDNAKLGIRS